MSDASPAELRVLGCLIEKQRTTPDQYPLTLNALRLACNQSTNRDPVVAYDEATVRDAARRLAAREWARLASGQGSRAVKYRHLLDRALELSEAELSLLAVLMLRGPQTPGELKQRGERLHPFASLEDVDEALSALAGRDLVVRVPRRPGQKEDRYAQLLGEGPEPGAVSTGPAAGPVAAPRQRVWPCLLYDDVDDAAAWLRRAFGFREVERPTRAEGGVHVQLELAAGAGVCLGQSPGGLGAASAVDAAGFVVVLVDSVDDHHARAVAAGAEIVEPLADSPTGHRSYGCADPQGHRWYFTTPLPDG